MLRVFFVTLIAEQLANICLYQINKNNAEIDQNQIDLFVFLQFATSKIFANDRSDKALYSQLNEKLFSVKSSKVLNILRASCVFEALFNARDYASGILGLDQKKSLLHC